MSVPTLSLDPSLRDAITDTQEEAFDALAERYGIEKTRRPPMTGIPYKVIERFARQNGVDMLVLGSSYHPGTETFIGGTAETLLNRAPCSLMIVKPLCGFG